MDAGSANEAVWNTADRWRCGSPEGVNLRAVSVEPGQFSLVAFRLQNYDISE